MPGSAAEKRSSYIVFGISSSQTNLMPRGFRLVVFMDLKQGIAALALVLLGKEQQVKYLNGYLVNQLKKLAKLPQRARGRGTGRNFLECSVMQQKEKEISELEVQPESKWTLWDVLGLVQVTTLRATVRHWLVLMG